jgi:hypothetical protein
MADSYLKFCIVLYIDDILIGLLKLYYTCSDDLRKLCDAMEIYNVPPPMLTFTDR